MVFWSVESRVVSGLIIEIINKIFCYYEELIYGIEKLPKRQKVIMFSGVFSSLLSINVLCVNILHTKMPLFFLFSRSVCGFYSLVLHSKSVLDCKSNEQFASCKITSNL